MAVSRSLWNFKRRRGEVRPRPDRDRAARPVGSWSIAAFQEDISTMRRAAGTGFPNPPTGYNVPSRGIGSMEGGGGGGIMDPEAGSFGTGSPKKVQVFASSRVPMPAACVLFRGKLLSLGCSCGEFCVCAA